MITLNKYNEINKETLNQFNQRNILFKSTGASCLEVENLILTLDNIFKFYNDKNAFFKRLNDSKFINYSLDKKCNLFYNWLLNWINTNKNTDKNIREFAKNTLLNHLAEASILFVIDEIKEHLNS